MAHGLMDASNSYQYSSFCMLAIFGILESMLRLALKLPSPSLLEALRVPLTLTA